jgi:hypothetical protein
VVARTGGGGEGHGGGSIVYLENEKNPLNIVEN